MSNLSKQLVVVLGVNMMLFLGQIAVINMASDNDWPSPSIGYSSSLLDRYGGGNYTLSEENPTDLLPSSEGGVETESGGVFSFITDSFNRVKTWFIRTLGIDYLLDILRAPYSFILAIKAPIEVAYAIGTLWYGYTLVLIVAFIFQRDA